ncbi:MAG: hypothetical protein M3Q78_03515 [Acidobacteriota bacterium]|nr:hypothetical protein [Acidobacteriota bacterium]
MKHQDFPNNTGEILSLEDEKIRNMIGGLKPVNAPKDFDFRLKARIAKAASTDFQPHLLPVLRYILPLSTILVIFAFVVLNGLYFPDNQAVSQVAETVPPTQVEQKSPPIMPFVDERVVAKDENLVVEDLPIKKDIKSLADKPQFIAVKSPTAKPKKNLSEKIDNSGGSRDSASTVPPINYTPKGTNLNPIVENPPNTKTLKPLNAQEILSQLGIEAIFTDAGWKVKSVKQEGLGVKVGDVIEAIDGEKLTDKPLSAKTVEVKKLTIMRGAEKIEISLRTNK